MTDELTEDMVLQKLVQDLSEFLEKSPYEPLFAFYKGVREGGALELARDLADTVLEKSGSMLQAYYLNGAASNAGQLQERDLLRKKKATGLKVEG